VTFRRSNIDCCCYVKRFVLLLYQLTDLLLPNYNSHSIQYAAVSQPDRNELAATKVPLSFGYEFQTDYCTTAGRVTEHIVRCCSSVIVHQQYIYFMLVKDKESKIHPPIRPEVSFCNLGSRRFGWSRPHPGRFPREKRPVTQCTRGWFEHRPMQTIDENVASTGIRYRNGPVLRNPLY